MYDCAAAEPSSTDVSGNASLCILTGVCAESSARMKDGWLSEDAWRDGDSKAGVPALLIGREKLKEGRGRADDSELTEGDRLAEPSGEAREWLRAGLPVDSLRGGREWNDPPMLPDTSSSVGVNGDDKMLEDRLGNSVLGGARPRSSSDPGFDFSGEFGVDSFCKGDGRVTELSRRLGEASTWCCD